MATRRINFRLYPTKVVEEKLFYHRRMHQLLYNAAVSNRFTQYEKFGHNVDYFEQQNSLPAFKEVWPEYKEMGAHTLQATLKRVDFAFQRWFKGLGKRPRYKSIRHYSGWTYPDKQSWRCHSIGNNGYLELDKIGSIQMRGKARIWGTPTTCTIVYRNGKWYASITVSVDDELINRKVGTGAAGIDIGCKAAMAITDGEEHQLIAAPQFLRKAERLIKKASKEKRRKRTPNHRKKVKASRRWKQAQKKVTKLYRKVANQRANWVHQVANRVVGGNSLVATEKLEVNKMTRKAKKGKRKKQKAGLNKSILDVGFGMLRSAIQYKVTEGGGVFIEVPTKKVKPSQTCPNCGYQHPKTLDEREHHCLKCGFVCDRDIAAALVMLYWAKGILPGYGTCLVDVDGSVPTSSTKTRKSCGSMKQIAQAKRRKSVAAAAGDAETRSSTQ